MRRMKQCKSNLSMNLALSSGIRYVDESFHCGKIALDGNPSIMRLPRNE